MAKAQSKMSLDENMNEIIVEIDQDDNDAMSNFENGDSKSLYGGERRLCRWFKTAFLWSRVSLWL